MPKVVVRKGYRCLPGKRRELLAALRRVDGVATEAGWPAGRYLFVETKAPGEPDVEVEFTFDSYSHMEQLERRLREHLARGAAGSSGGQGAAAIGSAGQEFLLEPSSTRYLLLLDDASATAPAPARRVTEPQPAPEPFDPPSASLQSPPPGRTASASQPASPPPMPAPAPMPGSPQPAIQRRQGYAGPPGGGAPGASPRPSGALPNPNSVADRIRTAGSAAGGLSSAAPGPARQPSRPVERIEDIERDFDPFDGLDTDQDGPPGSAGPPQDDLSGLSPAERRLRQLSEARAALSKAEDTVNVSPEQRARARQIIQRNPESD